MGKLALVLAVAAAACLIAAGSAVSDPAFAGQCGIKAQQTVWGEYGWPSLLPILAKPGTLLAVEPARRPLRRRSSQARRGNVRLRSQADERGGQARPRRPIPRPSRPPPRTSTRRPLSASGGCATPLDRRERALRRRDPHPLDGLDRAVPRERPRLPAGPRGAGGASRPPRQASRRSPGSSDAVAWWLSVAKVADIVREVYPPATTIWPLGPILATGFSGSGTARPSQTSPRSASLRIGSASCSAS